MPFVRAPQQEQGAVKDVPGRAKVIEEFVCLYCYFTFKEMGRRA